MGSTGACRHLVSRPTSELGCRPMPWKAPRLPARWLTVFAKVVRSLGVLAVCGTGVWVYGEVVDKAYPVRHWLVWSLLAVWGYTLLWSAACVAAGSSLLRLLLPGRKLPTVERVLLSMTAGAVVFVFVWNLAGALCQFQTWMSIALPVALLAAGAFGAPQLWRELEIWRHRPRSRSLTGHAATYVAVGWGLICIAFVYLEALPLDAINYDASWYHMTTAQDYARLGCIVPLPGENHKAYPHLTSLVQTWAFLVPGLGSVSLHWMLALHLEFSVVVWRIVGVAALAHWLLHEKDSRGLWPVFFLFPSIYIYDQSIGGSADHFLGFFAASILLTTARALKDFDWRMGTLAGIVAGGHVLTKYQSVYLVVAVAVVFAARWLYCVVRRVDHRIRRSPAPPVPGWRALAVGPLAVVLAAAVVSSPHFVKNTLFYGNPVYPLGLSAFSTSHPVHRPSEYTVNKTRKAFAAPHADDFIQRQLWATKLLYNYSFETHNRDFTAHRPTWARCSRCSFPVCYSSPGHGGCG